MSVKSAAAMGEPSSPPPNFNDKARRSRFHYLGKLVEKILFRPIIKTTTFGLRTFKLLTWVPAKAALYKISGYHTESADYLESQYLKTVKVARDILFTPSVIARTFKDMVASRKEVADDLPRKSTSDYLKVETTSTFSQFSSSLHGFETFEVRKPVGITEFAATSDASLNTIMASHLFKPGIMAINFGAPNVATFITEPGEKDTVQTIKVDAKSLYREEMGFHPTNGKIQSGVFFVPTNLPKEALEKFKEAATQLQGRKDITCVNTNCRVLEKAGFSIEGVRMDGVVFPTTLMEHLLYRNVFYTDAAGNKHKVHFDIINTTQDTLEEYFEKIDTAVVGTRLRHRRRNSDTEEKRQARGEAARALIAAEAERLANGKPVDPTAVPGLGQRKMTISVPSFFGDAIARIWGRHTIYEVDLADKKEMLAETFREGMLHPFPQEKPSFGTRLKRDLFFSGPMIRFLRRHMMGRKDTIHLQTQDLFAHLKSTGGASINYVLLRDKVVLARVKANSNSSERHKKAADWALSKHALLANREDVYCSGEIKYEGGKFVINKDSGTYRPSYDRLEKVVQLANEIFGVNNFEAEVA